MLNQSSANFSSALCNRGSAAPYQSTDVDNDIRDERSDPMIRKLTVALAAIAVVGTSALAPSAANATWRGYGWYGHPYYSYPGYAYAPGYFVYKPHYVYPRYFHRWKHAGWWNYRYH
jgi:hypothetical protein